MSSTEQELGVSLVKAQIMCSTLQHQLSDAQIEIARLQNDNARLQEIMRCDARRMVELEEAIEALS
jgi:hypothetical protein